MSSRTKPRSGSAVALGVLGLVAAVRAQPARFDGASFTCAEYVAAQDVKVPEQSRAELANIWMHGYLAGLHTAAEVFQLTDAPTDADALTGALLASCRELPNASFHGGRSLEARVLPLQDPPPSHERRVSRRVHVRRSPGRQSRARGARRALGLRVHPWVQERAAAGIADPGRESSAARRGRPEELRKEPGDEVFGARAYGGGGGQAGRAGRQTEVAPACGLAEQHLLACSAAVGAAASLVSSPVR